MNSVHANRRIVTAVVALAITAATAATATAAPAVAYGEPTGLKGAADAREPGGPPAVATYRAPTATLVRATALWQLSPPSPDPSGIVYMSDVDRLLIADSEVNEMTIYQGVNLWQISRAGTTLYDTGTTVAYSREPTGVGYDPVRKRVFVSDDDRERVWETTAGPDNRFGTGDDPRTWFSTSALGNLDPEDVTYDSTSGDLFLTEGMAQEIWRVSAGPNGRFDGVAPTGDDVVSHFDVARYGSIDVEGLAYYPVRDSLFLADRKLRRIIEVTKTGELLQTIDVEAIRMRHPAGITLAPTSNNPARTSIYVVTRGRDNNRHPDENDGMMYELSAPDLGPITQQPNQAPSVNAGPDRAVKLPTSAVLDGIVTDDGRPQPPGATTVAWSKVSGPGTVTFIHPNEVDTAANFSAPGTYGLRLSATDSALAVSDEVTVTVTGDATQVKTRCQGTEALAQLGPGSDDRLDGTGAVDLIQGGNGNDVVNGRGAGDCLAGGPGRDAVRGQTGKDLVFGNGGSDVIAGGADVDRLRPGGGKDEVDAGRGDDRVVTVDGKRDVVRCGGGDDRVVADRRDKVADSCERIVRKPTGR